jgi:basic membrane protein A
MKTKLIGAIASVMLLTACSAQPPSVTPTPVDFMGCVLSDNFGVDDQSVGSLSFLGALQAQAQFGIKLRQADVSANATYGEYSVALADLMENRCNLVVAVGGSAEVIEDKAELYPKVKFVEVHGRPYSVGEASGIDPNRLSNVKSISYNTEQGGFLAGYLAATQTATQVVGAFGATLNRAETAILAGFSQGVKYANSRNGTKVRVLGQASAESDFWVSVGQANSNETAAEIKSMISQGADVIVPVVGGTFESGAGMAALTTAAKSSSKVSIIGSVSNWYASDAALQVRSPVLASVLLNIQQDVATAIGDAVNGIFVGGPAGDYLGNLANSGVSLSGQNETTFNNNFVASLDLLQRQIQDGSLVVRAQLQ